MAKSGIIKIWVSLVFLMAMTAGVTQAQYAIGIKAGTRGVGGELTTSVAHNFNARLTGTFFSYKRSGVYTDGNPSIAYNTKLHITSVGALVDYFPFKKSLKVSAGLYYYDFSVDGHAAPNESYTLNGKTFQPDQMGSLSANVDYSSKIVPYLGIGLGNPVAAGSRIKLNVEIGAMYTNSPQVTMQGKGMIAPTAKQGQNFQDGMKDFKFYPVLDFGISYRISSK